MEFKRSILAGVVKFLAVGCVQTRPLQAVKSVHSVRRQYSQHCQHRQSCPEAATPPGGVAAHLAKPRKRRLIELAPSEHLPGAQWI
jgi:hypothetical protein